MLAGQPPAFQLLGVGDDLDVVHPVRTTYGTDGDEI